MKTVPVLAVGAAALLAGWGVTSVQAAKADTDLTIGIPGTGRNGEKNV